jgi:hypothetical protein
MDTATKLYDFFTGGGKDFKTPFSRGAGYWTSPQEELNQNFFGKLAEEVTQREDWYNVTPYISEFWCALSNAGFLYVGLKHKSYRVAFAGLASLVYHSYPKQWLLWVDRLGAVLAASEILENYTTLKNNPKILQAPLAVAGLALFADVYGGQSKHQPWIHVMWHLSAAWAADRLLTDIKKAQEQESQDSLVNQ